MAAQLYSEEDVKFKFLVPYLERKGYRQPCMAFNVPVEVQEGRKKKTIFADAVVYATAAHKAPLLVCETKAPREILDRQVREQVISYARLLPRIAPLALTTNGSQVQVFHTLNKNRISELPARKELNNDILKFVLDKNVQDALREEAKHELFIIDDVRTFKSILKACHNEIRNNEGLDPTAAFDEMSKMMFCKLYEEKENQQQNRFRLKVFDDGMDRLKINVVTGIFENAKASHAYSGLFEPHTRIDLQDRTIRRLVELLEDYDFGLTAFDVKGEAFEYFLGDTFTGGLGEYFTPRNIVEFMVEAINPKIGDKIIDPFCGTGGFMIYAFEVVGEKIRLQEFAAEEKKRWRWELSNKCLFGTDWKERTSQACKMNMMVHGDGSSGVFKHDGFINVPEKIEEGMFDICLTNPPFGAYETSSAVLNRYELGSGRNSQDRVILAVERSLRLVKAGGQIGIVVIDGILNNKSTKYVRDYIKKHAWIDAIVSLNKETFEGYGARAKTTVLLLRKKDEPDEGAQADVFMAIADNTGYAPNGAHIAGNVLPDILLDYRAHVSGEPVGKHSRSWRSALGDRLDAEFYADTEPGSGTFDVETVREQIRTAQDRAAVAVGTLSDPTPVLSHLSTAPVRLGDLVSEIAVKERLSASGVYRLVGVRWWGEGAFIREEKLGKDIKAKSLRPLEAGWIIYNRLFAFRGSFAITSEVHAGCYVSGEFPTFKVKDEVPNRDLVARYIVHCLNSPQYLARIDRESTGSTKTSRNRFNQTLFVNLPIYMPQSPQALADVVRLLDETNHLRSAQEKALKLVKSYREGVLTMLPAPSHVLVPEASVEPPITPTPRQRRVRTKIDKSNLLAGEGGQHDARRS